MDTERTFTFVNDKVLVERISQASQRVVSVAPGWRQPVAKALKDALRRLPGKVTIVLNVDDEVCRLGYGDDKGLEFIKDAAETAETCVLHQPGAAPGC